MVLLHLQWTDPVSQLLADKISGSVMHCFNSVKVITIFIPRSAFSFSPKDILPILQQGMMVCKFQYQCDTDYIGGTITIFITRSAFSFSQKDILPILQQRMMMYKFQYQCDTDYIGGTTQRLEIQVKQHIPRELLRRSQNITSRFSQAQESTIADHLCDHYLQDWLLWRSFLCSVQVQV